MKFFDRAYDHPTSFIAVISIAVLIGIASIFIAEMVAAGVAIGLITLIAIIMHEVDLYQLKKENIRLVKELAQYKREQVIDRNEQENLRNKIQQQQVVLMENKKTIDTQQSRISQLEQQQRKSTKREQINAAVQTQNSQGDHAVIVIAKALTASSPLMATGAVKEGKNVGNLPQSGFHVPYPR